MAELPSRGIHARFVGGHSEETAVIIGRAEVIDLTVNRVRVTIMPTTSSRAERAPDREESSRFLALADQVPERFRPHVLLTYGGHPTSLEPMRRSRARGIAVVFHVHNFGFNDQWATEHARTPAVENRKPDQTPRSRPGAS
jgi:hypothetical protein